MSLWLFYIVYVTVAILSYGYLVTWRFCMWRFCNMAVLYVAVLYPHPTILDPTVFQNPCIILSILTFDENAFDALYKNLNFRLNKK